jgi:hypothetical protein
MSWVRSNIRHGSRLALIALAIQFVLAFGHFHAIAAYPDAGLRASAAQQHPASDHDPGGQSNDICAICAVMALADTALFATPPVLPLPQAVETAFQAVDAWVTDANSLRVAFQPRAPPIS